MAQAQSPAEPPTAAPAIDAVPPRLIEAPPADYPPEALAAHLEGSVVLRLTIDKAGHVVKVDVVEPVGHGFDEAAAGAALRFRFEPARRGGAPVGARILHRYDFKLPADIASAPPPKADIASAPPPKAEDASAPRPKPDDAAAAPQEAPATAALPAPQAAMRSASTPSVEVTVRGQSEAEKLRGSAEAVTVVETRRAQKQTRDMGDVLASVEGTSVRRSGGLGSFSRFTLNGLSDRQIVFYLDDVPLDVAGYPFGVANVPVGLIERVEIFRGVLPVRFGADALGGALNLVSDTTYDTRAEASYQRSSFGTHRTSMIARYRHDPTGFIAGTSGWFDVARNDYDIDVDLGDKLGRTVPTRVRRFHDAYRGYGGAVDLGFVDRPWAARAVVKLFGSAFDKQIQNDLIMKTPYGEATYGESVFGATAHYDQPLSPRLSLSAVASGGRRTIRFLDVASTTYDWYGHRGPPRTNRGEVLQDPHDSTLWQDNAFGRAQLEWRCAPAHALRLASTGRLATRHGVERAFTLKTGDPLAPRRTQASLVTGLELELNAIDLRPPEERRAAPPDPARDDRLQNIVFVKHYLHRAAADLLATSWGSTRNVDVVNHRVGLGDSLRFRLSRAIMAKASYELATRLPTTDEFYGDGVAILPNPDLHPEHSHNVNLGLRVETGRTRLGSVAAEAGSFLRETSDLIGLYVESTSYQYRNIYSARAAGVEASTTWISPGSWLVLDGNATWQDVRNTSTSIYLDKYAGDRIPNTPWLFANWSARLSWRGGPARGDELAFFYFGRYIHDFFRTWESFGDTRFKKMVPTQTSHSVGVYYAVQGPVSCSATLELDNVLDQKLYDFYGVQRPGRSIALKVTGEL